MLAVENLKVHFPVLGGIFRRRVGSLRAVDGVSLSLEHGETLGIVGESGCGKSTLGRAIVRLVAPTSGRVMYRDRDVGEFNGDDLKSLRREVQMVFQDPYSSLNPRMSIFKALEEPLRIHGVDDAGQRAAKIERLVETVGLRREDLFKYPHEFSGGQRQRIVIARALVLEPKLVIADEPVSALDVSIQSQVLNLLVDLQESLGLTYIFISHDLTVVKYIADRVAVMYLGRIAEIANADDIYANPRHPYTRALLSALPVANPRLRVERPPLEGDVPSPSDPPSGCAFHTRCRYARDLCKTQSPELRLANGNTAHTVACHFSDELDA